MADADDFETLEGQLDQLETSLGSASGLVANFDMELKRVNETFSAAGQGVKSLERSLSSGLGRAIDGVVLDGGKLSDALRHVSQSLIQTAYKAAVKPVTDHFGGMIAQGVGGLFGAFSPFADGAGFAQGRVMPFASGGVVNGPVTFPMRGGLGLMGEAGPEAILPLARGTDGKLGVRGGGAGQINIVMNVSTPDVAGFRRSQSQIAANVARALGQGQRNR